MSWEGYERHLLSARALGTEMASILDAIDYDDPASWLAASYVVTERLKTVTGLLENLQWGLCLKLYDKEPEADQPKNLPPPAGG